VTIGLLLEKAASAPAAKLPVSACEPYRELIALELWRGRNAMAIRQNLVDGHGFAGGCQSLKRFLRTPRGAASPEPRAIIQTAPGEECQVDYGTGPMVRDPVSGNYRRTRLFVPTLGYSRKSVRLLTFRSSTRVWAELHEKAFRKMNRSLVFDLASTGWLGRREGALFVGPPGRGKSHLAQAIGDAVIQQGYRGLYREAHILLEELADATLEGNHEEHMELLSTVPLLISDDLGMRKLPLTAAEELLEIVMRRRQRASTPITGNRPVVDDGGKLLGDSAAVTAMLGRLLHYGQLLKGGPRSWRAKTGTPGDSQ
jgi:DNA replication protein DnaC